MALFGHVKLPPFSGATGWLNSEPLTPEALLGRVVLVDFWTYTCVNWLRTLPYLRTWAQRYGEHGLVIVGVHTPEFPFEHDPENVRRAVLARAIDYPVAMDNDYAVWKAFDNHYWPAVYAADAGGSIRYNHFGEGRYEETERLIRELLAQNGASGLGSELVSVEPADDEAPADWANLGSPETYLGYERADRLASPGRPARGEIADYELPPALKLNHWALAGVWTVRPDVLVAGAPAATLAYRFQARDVNLVMGPAPGHAPVPFRVRIDRAEPGDSAGVDVDEHGNGVASEQRMYQLVRRSGPPSEHTFEIVFLEAGVECYVFTFG